MERVTTWRSSLWVRWLGWTVLYALVVYGVSFGLTFAQTHEIGFRLPFPFSGPPGSLLSFLVPAVLAFVIGVRFRSQWWGLGPLTVLALPAALFIIQVANPALDKDSQGWAVVVFLFFVVYGAMFALIGIAGVWWGKRRQHEIAFRDGGPVDDDSRPGQS